MPFKQELKKRRQDNFEARKEVDYL